MATPYPLPLDAPHPGWVPMRRMGTRLHRLILLLYPVLLYPALPCTLAPSHSLVPMRRMGMQDQIARLHQIHQPNPQPDAPDYSCR